MYLLVGFLLHKVCKVKVFHGFDQVFEAEITQPLELEGIINQSLIMLPMSQGNLANVDCFLQHILLNQGDGKVIGNYWVFRIGSDELLEIFRGLQDES